MENMELAEMINRFLAGMKTENRRIFVRRYWYFDSIAEIAKRFSVSESKVKSSLMRSRESLRKCLAQEGIEAVKKQEEFEEMKKKTRNMMFGLAAVFVLAVAGVAAYKAMRFRYRRRAMQR